MINGNAFKDSTQNIVLCADDFGLDSGIDRAIIALAEKGRISAASCMVGGRSWRQSAPMLAVAQPGIAAGLHLTFTDLVPLGAMKQLAPGGQLPRLGQLLRLALTGGLDPDEIRAECRRQIDGFTDAMGVKPHHIDGHQHVHCFPVIRDSVIELAAEYGCAVRSCATPPGQILNGNAVWRKAAAVNLMGRGFRAALTAAHIPHNRQFFGLHDFSPDADICGRYMRWISAAKDAALINCHPGDGNMPNDSIAAWRAHEYRFLQSEDFTGLLQETGRRVERFTLPLAPAG